MRKNKFLILSQQDAARDRKKWRVGIVGIALLFGGMTAFGTVQQSDEPEINPETVIEELALSFGESLIDDTDQVYWREERFARGDTFMSFLNRLGVNSEDARTIVRQNGGAQFFRTIGPGMSVQAETSAQGDLYTLRLLSGRDSVVGLKREGDRFTEFDEAIPLTRSVQLSAGAISSSLFGSTDAAGLPDAIATQIAEIFSGDVDFHRDLRRGDRFSVVYEMYYHGGQAVKTGRVLAAEFVNNGRSFRAAWYEDKDGRGSYYAPDGKSLRKAFLRSPLEFSRVTSGFSRRFHPILKQWRQHKGVDYGAPSGTRIRATADGIVDFVGRKGGYGNTVVLRHHAGITTLYAHMKGFGQGIRRGARVEQGQVIGYVGATGWATGPHLHYEFHVHGVHRNPLTIAMPSADPLPANKIREFKEQVQPNLAQLDFLSDVRVASID